MAYGIGCGFVKFGFECEFCSLFKVGVMLVLLLVLNVTVCFVCLFFGVECEMCMLIEVCTRFVCGCWS